MNPPFNKRYMSTVRLPKPKDRRYAFATLVLPTGSTVSRAVYSSPRCCDSGDARTDTKSESVSRRCFLTTVIYAAPTMCALLSNARPSIGIPFMTEKPESVLSRLNRAAPGQPKRKVYANDLFYPDYFLGAWTVRSTLLSVQCPAGYKLFGRPGSFEEVQKTINSTLEYNARFVKHGNTVVSDRAYNVQAIAEASMGPRSVLYRTEPEESPYVMRMSIRPNLADGNIFDVKLHVVARQQETIAMPLVIGRRARSDGSDIYVYDVDETNSTGNENDMVNDGNNIKLALVTSETVRQNVMLKNDDLRVAPQIKEIETTTVFELNATSNTLIKSWQRTCTYLPKSDLRYIDTKGRPVDVRWYELQYVKLM